MTNEKIRWLADQRDGFRLIAVEWINLFNTTILRRAMRRLVGGQRPGFNAGGRAKLTACHWRALITPCAATGQCGEHKIDAGLMYLPDNAHDYPPLLFVWTLLWLSARRLVGQAQLWAVSFDFARSMSTRVESRRPLTVFRHHNTLVYRHGCVARLAWVAQCRDRSIYRAHWSRVTTTIYSLGMDRCLVKSSVV